MRSGVETIMAFNSAAPISVILEPGEGTLFRIRPAYDMIAGRTSDAGMAYNNGHRIADLSDDENGDPQRIMVWENKGQIEYALVNSPTQSGIDNFVTPSSGTFLTSVTGLLKEVNPSVASKPSVDGTQDTIAVIWSETSGTNPRVIHYAWTVSTVATTRTLGAWTSVTFGTPGNVPWDAVNTTKHLVTPSITPALDGFFVCWAYPKVGANPPYIQPALIGFWGNPTKSTQLRLFGHLQAESNATMCVFPSVASMDESSLASGFERLHVAWEEDLSDGYSQIYYMRYAHTLGTGSSDVVDESFTIERVSKQLITCWHHHPNIALNYYYTTPYTASSATLLAYSEPLVTWESVLMSECDDVGGLGIVVPYSVLVVERERYGDVDNWSAVTSFYPKVGNLPLPLIKTSGRLEQCCIDCILGYPGPIMGDEILSFQDLASNQVHVRQLNLNQCGPNSWLSSSLLDPGLYPNLTEPFEFHQGFFSSTFTYRGAIIGEDGLFDAKITTSDNPPEISETASLFTSMTVAMPLVCEQGLRYTVGPGSVGSPTAAEPRSPGADSTARHEIHWMYKDVTKDGFGTPYNPSDSNHRSHSTTSYGWPITEDSIRTNNFVVDTGASIHIASEIMLDDSAEFQTLLPDSSHFVTFKMVLKDSASKSTIQVIDQFTLRGGSGLGAEIAGLGSCHTQGGIKISPAILPPSHIGYLTVLTSRDVLTPLDFSSDNGYIENWMPPLNTSDSSFKIGTNQQAARAKGIQLFVYPNPFKHSTTVNVTNVDGLPTTVGLYDVLGNLIKEEYRGTPSVAQLSLNVEGSGLRAGTYFVRVVAGNSVGTKRLVILR
jgi:hypothetical protein